jgi:hypothetical protein
VHPCSDALLNAKPGLQLRRLGKTLCARHQSDDASIATKGVLIMIKLGKVSVETRGDKLSFIPEVSGEPEVFA